MEGALDFQLFGNVLFVCRLLFLLLHESRVLFDSEAATFDGLARVE